MSDKERWYLSSDGRRFDEGPYDTPEAAIEAAAEVFDLEPGEEFWVGRQAPITYDLPDADSLLDHIADQIADQAGADYAERCFNTTKEQRDDLDAALDREFRAWLDRHQLRPTVFAVEAEQKHTVPHRAPSGAEE